MAPRVVSEKFPEINAFALVTSRLLVAEVRRRASNHSTEEAAVAIASYLQVNEKNEEPGSSGWLLLSALNVLGAEGDPLSEVMTSASLPSTLVKCLYLFFDLPEAGEPAAAADDDAEFTAKERRVLLQKMFLQVLSRLCTYVPAVEELARKDDLSLLFSAVTSACPQHNVLWRKTAADILLTISRQSLSQPVISFLHNKGCIAVCIENLRRSPPELSPLETVESFVTIFCFLKDSSQDTDTLMEDFRSCHGYSFLTEFLLRLDSEVQTSSPSAEASEAIRNLVLLVASLSFCGHKELEKPNAAASASASLYQLDSFVMPEPENKGSTVRNMQAFGVLQTVFSKSRSEALTATILDAISTILTADNANYFLLEDRCHCLPQMAEKIAQKPARAQEKFFQLVEFVVQHLKHIPTKELIAISLLLKAGQNYACSFLGVQCVANLARFDPVIKEALREVGMLEALVGVLQHYADKLQAGSSDDEKLVLLGEITMGCLGELLTGCAANVAILRETGGAAAVFGLVRPEESRDPALALLAQMILTPSAGDEDMTALLELLHTSGSGQDLDLKIDIIHTLINCLRESHRCRSVFRRVGGFVYVTSVLVSLEGALGSETARQIHDVTRVYALLRAIFTCLTIAMRYEPANAKYFQIEMNCGTSLIETVKLLGCFSESSQAPSADEEDSIKPQDSHYQLFHQIFTSDISEYPRLESTTAASGISKHMFSACVVMRMLYDMAVDNYEKSKAATGNGPLIVNRREREDDEKPAASQDDIPRRLRIPTLNLTPIPPDPVIVHSGVVTTLLKLLPLLHYKEQPELSVALRLFAADTIKSLLRTERNQQIMASVDFLSDIFEICPRALEDENYPLHPPFQYLLERLAAQKLDPKDLRTFLRLGHPLSCLTDDEKKAICLELPANQKIGGFLPLTRIKTLVSMTTPRDMHEQNNSILPPFIELDMAPEGFGCLYIPSLAPSSPHTASSVVVGVGSLASQESSVIGGIGQGDRAFPPQSGLTYATWVCIDKFSDPRSDPHPVRLLTLGRTVKGMNNSGSSKDKSYVCLSVCLSARDKALIVSTQESLLSKTSDWHPDFSGEHGARIWFPDLIKEGEWHHIVVVLNRQAIKNPTFSLYVNGQHIATQKMYFIAQYAGGGVAHVNTSTSLFGFIGTPPQWRKHSRLNWKQGPCLLFEDVANHQLVGLLYKLGPHYLGSLQAPQIATTGEVLTSQISEEKLLLGLNAVAVSTLTLARMRKIYAKVDSKSIARQLSMSTGENATPIRVVHNSVGHLLGPARSLGGVVIGYLGVRVFTPQPVSKVIETIGGCNVLLGIIAMSRDMESLYAGVKALVCVLKSNPFSRCEMDKSRGYQKLAMLLRKKIPFLNSHILYLMFTMAGTIDSGKEVIGIPNISAFRDVLCDLELWHEAPNDLEKSLFEHFYELLADTNMQRNGGNIRTLREFSLVEKLLSILKKSESSNITTLTLLNVIHALLCASPRVTDVLCFALFTAATLDPSPSVHESTLLSSDEINSDGTEYVSGGPKAADDETKPLGATVVLRNRCLKLFFSLLYMNNKVHSKYCEDVVQVVGFDWILLFLQGHLHPTTIVWGLRILSTLLSLPVLKDKFRMGSSNGHWLIKSEVVLQNKMVQALGQSSTTSSKVTRRGIRQDIFSVPGFQHLNWLLPRHIEVAEVYFLVLAMVLGQPVRHLPEKENRDFNLDNVWNFVFGKKSASGDGITLDNSSLQKIQLSGDAMISVMSMVRALLNSETKHPDRLPTWLHDYPVTLTQFIVYLYHNLPDFMMTFMTEDVLTALVGTMFPTLISATPSPESASQAGSAKESPVHQEKTGISDEASDSSSPNDRPPLRSYGSVDDSVSALTNHPAKRNVLQFMRTIIVDSLSLQASPKTSPVIDLLLDAQPENTTHSQQCRFQTELLGLVMDHLLAADVLLGDQAAIPVVVGGSQSHIAPNVFYLASRLVDKLWAGIFKKDPDEVFTFILKLISQAKRRSGTQSLSLEGIYRSLNRTILYMMSRPHESVAAQMNGLEVLHKLTTHRSIIFGAGNHELEFFGCLVYCLLQISEGKTILTDAPNATGDGQQQSRSQWHVQLSTEEHQKAEDDPEAGLEEGELATRHQSRQLLRNAASRVWEELYVCKRPALEEVFKTSFGTANSTPTLDKVRLQINEQASKVWFNQMELERKAERTTAYEFQTQLESRIQRITGGVAGGLKRLTSITSRKDHSSSSKSKAKKEELAKVEYSKLPRAIVEQATLSHVSIVGDVVEHHYRNRAQTDAHMLKFTEEDWLNIETELTQERGIWGPHHESELAKWMMDLAEGPSRMRKRLIRNEMFYLNYPYKEPANGGGASGDGLNDPSLNVNHKPHKYKRPSSHDSRLWAQRHQPLSMFERGNINGKSFVETLEYDDCDVAVDADGTLDIDQQIQKIGIQGLKTALTQATVNRGDADPVEDDDGSISESKTGSVSSLTGEKGGDLDTPTSPGGGNSESPAAAAVSSTATEKHLDTPTSPTNAPMMEEESSDYQTVMRLLEDGEKITHMYRCARIQGLDTAEGLLLFGKEHFYILDGFTLVNGREVHDIDYIPANRYEPIIPVVPGQVSRMKSKREVKKLALDQIKEVHKRRYLLQPIAVEVFIADGQNYLLSFNKHIRPKVYQRFLSLATGIADSAALSVAGQRHSANVEQSSGLLSSLMGETSVTQRWVRGEITNFQYLMALNTLAGRSYNDLMQYPVFPWVLADYTSEDLDLTKESTFRDLSKPMGAQTQARLDQFRRRYEDWDDPHNDSPPYHYGTHYSSAMIVSSYLVRMEPFTQHFLHLQGGHFDLADRMFHSIDEAWESASKNNMADLRELIPEFFYLPDFLENRNRFDIGTKQNGESLDNVILPPWAKGSPQEFVRAHREALESDYVSAHLHEWIDLIFGFRQQGPAAVESCNVFHHLFYEGNVDIFSIEDPLQRNATIGFINNFGQIPKQLFKKLHPAKRVSRGVMLPAAATAAAAAASTASTAAQNVPTSPGSALWEGNSQQAGGGAGASPGSGTTGSMIENAPGVHMNSKVFFHHLTNLRPSMSPIKELKGPVGQIQYHDRVVYAVEQNKVLVPGNSNRYLAWGYADQSFRLGNYDSDKAVFICEPNYLIGQVLTCVCPNPKVVLTAGTSTVVAVYEYHKKVKQLLIRKMLYGHTEAVTCLAASPAWNIAVSGSRDRTAIIWDLSRYCYVKHLPDHVGPIAAVTINELTGDIVTCAGSWLYLWDINGRLQASVDTASSIHSNTSIKPQQQHQILCVTCSQYNEWDRENVIMTGSNDGIVRMWSVDYVEVPADKVKAEMEEAELREKEAQEANQQKDRSGSSADKNSESQLLTFAKHLNMNVANGTCLNSLREAIAQARPKDDEDDDEDEDEDQASESQTKANKSEDLSSNAAEEAADQESDADDRPTFSPSVSTTGAAGESSDGFVVVSESDVSSGSGSGRSADGYTWVQRLVFRAKLTMHTAFERKDNTDPAAVTALAISKDHRTIYVGDEKGRVFSWTVSSKPGKGMVDHWCRDEGSGTCVGCGVKFTIYERRHHCRACGKLFCSSCSRWQASIPSMRIHQKVRVCKACFDLQQQPSK